MAFLLGRKISEKLSAMAMSPNTCDSTSGDGMKGDLAGSAKAFAIPMVEEAKGESANDAKASPKTASGAMIDGAATGMAMSRNAVAFWKHSAEMISVMMVDAFMFGIFCSVLKAFEF